MFVSRLKSVGKKFCTRNSVRNDKFDSNENGIALCLVAKNNGEK